MKKSVLIACILLLSYFGFAQSELIVQSNEKGMHLVHTVSPKENFYAIGRLYNISPKDIAAYNALDMNSGLNIGQTILIPLNDSNFSQTSATGTPVYYVVGEKEGLYRVSMNNNKVLMNNLRKWNNLSSDGVVAGQKLIVGYLTSQVAPSSNISNTTPAVVTNQPETVSVKTEPKTEQPQPKPVQKQAEPIIETKPVLAVNNPANNTAAVQNAATNGTGYFKNQFDLQAKKYPVNNDQTATAGIFKTTSGWQDGKYYALIDNVEPGTIIKVINPTNNKIIYAKVLGEMSGIRQNQGLEVRISNAAASALDVTETDKFIVKVNY